MNQEEADQDAADEVSEEVDSRGKVMRSEKKNIISPNIISRTIMSLFP